ncbi:hypothetical protein [Pseudomonas sp. TNT2022 ID642]|jgi:uncharacterized membrane protein YjfL (UPF0719 family)|uniref:hypothetical protein n=1 Tax=Pseudomonas sp. TNT2022 ID642 TaxID=2942632 RepID=UPI002361EE65|nr:hypothetical protein [Pseudomonas sp. TNT2022 ID642]MDD1003618.1 hypothetical protein [Pseudomonas sp. TNT2022 ID642]
MPKFKRLKALLDKSAWLLILPSLLALFLIDTAMLQTLIQWLVFAPVLAGLAIIVSRVVFPQIHLSTLVEQIRQGNIAAGLLASALVLFVAIVIMALVMWAKA